MRNIRSGIIIFQQHLCRRSLTTSGRLAPPTKHKLPPRTAAAATSSSSPLFRLGRHQNKDRSKGSTTNTAAAAAAVPEPTAEQLRAHFLSNALRMMGFGFMDQTVMLQAGHSIDLTLGVAFGLSTLTAAALGEVCSNTCGTLFGGTLERLAKRTSARHLKSGMTAAQRSLPKVQRVQMTASVLGVITGCCLGLVNLLFLDTDRPTTLKYQAEVDENEFAFSIECSNSQRDDATIITVRGPDVDGILASMTTTLTNMEYSLVDLDAHRRTTIAGAGEPATAAEAAQELLQPQPVVIEDVFAVVRQGTLDKIPDDELKTVARALLEATSTPVNNAALTMKVKDMEERNGALQDRIQKLEEIIKERNIKVLPSPI